MINTLLHNRINNPLSIQWMHFRIGNLGKNDLRAIETLPHNRRDSRKSGDHLQWRIPRRGTDEFQPTHLPIKRIQCKLQTDPILKNSPVQGEHWRFAQIPHALNPMLQSHSRFFCAHLWRDNLNPLDPLARKIISWTNHPSFVDSWGNDAFILQS